MKMDKQLYFDLDYDSPRAETDQDHQAAIAAKEIVRAVIRWLLLGGIHGLAVGVPTRVKRYRADVAGFWNHAGKLADGVEVNKLLVPSQTVVVECRTGRAACWPDCAASNVLLPRLRELKTERQTLEAEIQQREPELRESSGLFDEYSEWNYSGSTNKQYHRVRRDIEKTEKALYKGTRFESLRAAGVADYLYLAVPEYAVHPHELADGWGLLWVSESLSVTVAGPAEDRKCSPGKRFHLVQNIASAALGSVLFAYGIRQISADYQFGPMPRRRRIRSPQN